MNPRRRAETRPAAENNPFIWFRLNLGTGCRLFLSPPVRRTASRSSITSSFTSSLPGLGVKRTNGKSVGM